MFGRSLKGRRFGKPKMHRITGNKKVEIVKKFVPNNSSLNNKIKRIENKEEIKNIDTYQNVVNVTTAGVLTLLNGVAQGTTPITRIGNETAATSIQFRAQYIANTAELSGTLVRMIIFWDRQPNGAAPTVATLLDSSVITLPYLAPYHRDYQKRYKIVYDKTMVLNPGVESATTPATGVVTAVIAQERVLKKKLRLGREVKYSGAGATVASIQTNSLYVLQISDAAQNPSVIAGYRFYYKDT